MYRAPDESSVSAARPGAPAPPLHQEVNRRFRNIPDCCCCLATQRGRKRGRAAPDPRARSPAGLTRRAGTPAAVSEACLPPARRHQLLTHYCCCCCCCRRRLRLSGRVERPRSGPPRRIQGKPSSSRRQGRRRRRRRSCRPWLWLLIELVTESGFYFIPVPFIVLDGGQLRQIHTIKHLQGHFDSIAQCSSQVSGKTKTNIQKHSIKCRPRRQAVRLSRLHRQPVSASADVSIDRPMRRMPRHKGHRHTASRLCESACVLSKNQTAQTPRCTCHMNTASPPCASACEQPKCTTK
jgi:hypothetical protein